MSEPIALPARLDLSNVARLRDELLARAGQNVSLDLTDVTHFGALAVQVVIAASRQAQATGKTISLRNVSNRIVDQLRSMGVTPETITEGQP